MTRFSPSLTSRAARASVRMARACSPHPASLAERVLTLMRAVDAVLEFLDYLARCGGLGLDAENGEGPQWITVNGAHVPLDAEGRPTGNVGKKLGDHEWAVSRKRDLVADAMEALANGAAEATIPALRDDLEQYGGTNDVTLVKGDQGKGLVHIAQRHGAKSIPGVLEAVVSGRIVRSSKEKKTVTIQKDGYEAILSLDEHGRQKTWLLTGYAVLATKKELPGGDGKFCARHAPTRNGPTFGRPVLGADNSLVEIIGQIFPEGKALKIPESGPGSRQSRGGKNAEKKALRQAEKEKAQATIAGRNRGQSGSLGGDAACEKASRFEAVNIRIHRLSREGETER